MSMPDTQQQSPQENQHHLLLVILFALSMLALLVISIVFISPEIEKDLNQKVTEELEKKGIEAIVTVSGRDVTLSGTVKAPEDVQHAQKSTTKICGIHFIDNQLVPHDKLTKAHTPLIATQPTITNATIIHAPPKEAAFSPIIKSENITNTKNNHAIQEKTIKPKQSNKSTTTYRSSEAYEKILTAMSRYNENKKIASTTAENSNSAQYKNPIDFDTKTIQFKKNTSALTTNAKKSLTLLAEKLKKTKKTIEIIVTSKKSDIAFNRAKKIQHYLIKQGLKKSHLIIIGRTSNTENKVTIVEHHT